MRILLIGDIVGRPGRRALRALLPGFLERYQPQLVIANGENAAGGKGLTRKVVDELYDLGVDLITLGNHTWGKRDLFNFIDQEKGIVRPLNYPPQVPGQGWQRVETRDGSLIVVNLLGRTNMQGPLDCPFQTMEQFLATVKEPVLVDFHAETTSEKAALAWFLDGKVAAVVGTHTHVQTADARILPQGTAFITDLGMTGPRDSILGVETEIIVERFRTGLPQRFQVAKGPVQLAGAFIELAADGTAKKIESFFEFSEGEEEDGGTR